MLIIKPIVLSLSLFIVTFSTIAQDVTYKPGFYISNVQDTIHGFIHVNQKMINPHVFKFKSNLDDKDFMEISFVDNKIISTGNENYAIWYGTRGMSYISPNDFLLTDLDSFRTETIALKQIYKGKRFSLFYFKDVTEHFFIGQGNDIQELKISYRYLTSWESKNYLINQPTYFKIATFQNQLMALLGEELTKSKKNYIESCTYERNPLIRTIKKMESPK